MRSRIARLPISSAIGCVTSARLERVSEQTVQTEFGEFRLVAYEDRVQHGVHLALVCGGLDQKVAPLVRCTWPTRCATSWGFAVTRAPTLRAALERVAQSGKELFIILREPEDPQELTEALRALAHRPPAARIATQRR